MTSDFSIKNWIVDIPYLFKQTTKPETSKRYYFIHENVDVFDENGNFVQLYTLLNSTSQSKIYLVDPTATHGSWCINYFMVLNPYSLSSGTTDNLNIRMNGKLIGKNIRSISERGNIYKNLKNISNKSYCEKTGVITMFNEESRLIKIPGTCIKKFGFDVPYSLETNFKRKSEAHWNKIKRINENNKFPPRQYLKYVTKLEPNFPRKKFSKRDKPNPPNIHWGQLKLLMSEIEFLTSQDGSIKDGIVLYAGAAGGYHIPLLSRMFPDLLFVLYDPAVFGIKPTPNIIIRQEFFTDEVAKLYSKVSNVYFISDIRLDAATEYEFEELVLVNNEMNKKWISIIKPRASMLKFRFPFIKPYHRTFLKGDINFQVFAKVTSAETRLIIDSNTSEEYDTIKYEEQMVYFNQSYRNRSFLDLDPVFGINYDMYKTYVITLKYLQKQKILDKNSPDVDRWNSVSSIFFEIEKLLGKRGMITRYLR
ncbi:hypothetical protein OAG24_00965 [bacterium]|nr:hypothetical protein [bacterium]